MLTDNPYIVTSGRLDQDIHLPFTAKLELVEFIANELPRWRDHPDRPRTQAEAKLTEYLCDHLNHAAYYSIAWSHIQFRTETSDEIYDGRKMDLSVKPLAAAFIIEGRRYSRFDVFLPIECKRLPTPKEKNRDEREYVITEPGTTGGIQRFKFGYHGAAHTFAVMIAYVQEQSFSHWLKRINHWIQDLSIKPNSPWRDSDLLQLLSDNSTAGVCTFKSRHQRIGGNSECELRHLWIRMN